jgi:hypothetical protein
MKNWKNDDELLNLAFGELSDRDSQAFEAKLLGDASAQKELELLRTLRSDFTAIRDDIPEMQFSKQRLRQAIAACEERPQKQPKKWINWVLGPLALASVAGLTFVLSERVSPRETVIVSNGKPSFRKTLPRPIASRPSPIDGGFVATETSTGSDKERAIAKSGTSESAGDRVRAARLSKKRIRPRINTAILVASRADEQPTMRTVATQPNSGVANDTTAMSLAGAPPAESTQPSPETAPIILIDAKTDSGVGAPTATEVRNPINVAIGG